MRAFLFSFGRAPTADGEKDRDQEQLRDCPEQPPAPVPKLVLSRRAAVMFSGTTGAVVKSGEGLATSRPTFKLIKEAFEVVNDLPPELFTHGLRRPCGLLDKYAAGAMLIGDVLGLPLLPWILAEPIGKIEARMPAKIQIETKKAKKAAQRKGMAVEGVAEAVLNCPVELTFPQADVIARTWRQIEMEAMPLPPPRVLELPAEVAPRQAPPLVDAAPPSLTDVCRRAFYEVAVASAKAHRFENIVGELDDPDEWEGKCEPDEYEAEEADYKAALFRLKKAVPELNLVLSDLVKGVRAEDTETRQCFCGAGLLSVFPWVLHSEALGFCKCEHAQYELICWRSDIIDAGAPGLRW